jgi:PPOX class probable F420-dependent enzyme
MTPMAKQRDVVRMTDAEAWAYIESQRDMHVATIGKDGSPHLTTNWFALVDGRVVFTSYETSQKIVNLRRDPRITLLFADGRMYGELRAVSVKGTAQIISDALERDRAFAAIFQRNASFYGGVDTSIAKRAVLEGRRACVKITAERVISWDHSKLA